MTIDGSILAKRERRFDKAAEIEEITSYGRVLNRITTFVVIEFIDQLIISIGKYTMFFPQVVMYLLVCAIRKFMIWYHVVHLHPGVINGIIHRSHSSCINN